MPWHGDQNLVESQGSAHLIGFPQLRGCQPGVEGNNRETAATLGHGWATPRIHIPLSAPTPRPRSSVVGVGVESCGVPCTLEGTLWTVGARRKTMRRSHAPPSEPASKAPGGRLCYTRAVFRRFRPLGLSASRTCPAATPAVTGLPMCPHKVESPHTARMTPDREVPHPRWGITYHATPSWALGSSVTPRAGWAGMHWKRGR